MKRISLPALPFILILCLGVLFLGCPDRNVQSVNPELPDSGDGVINDAGSDADVSPPDTDIGDGGEVLPDGAEIDTDVPDPCVCEQGINCGQKPGCVEDCGGCFAGDYCLEFLEFICVPEGSPGTPCPEEDDCEQEAPCLDTAPQVCSGFCEDDGDCPKHMMCKEQPGLPDPVFLCIPVCEDTPDCGDDSCGFLDDDCGTFVPCGDCEGDNQLCGTENTCECEFEACDEVCCDIGETCVDGACALECDPACEKCFVCTGGTCAPMDCPAGTHCEDDVCVEGGVPCDPCGSVDDCAPGLTCSGGACRSEDDETCDGCDDDGDGETDDDYIPLDDCGEGVCHETATASICLGGVVTPCQPGEPLADEDTTCDAVDDDCDGDSDEDYVPDASCGVGACQGGNTPSTCDAGVETECVVGEPIGEVDATCDGEDDDCDGDVDEDYVPDDTCGVGWCYTNNTASSCVDGAETPCEPGPPAPADTSCNGVDDDCSDGPDDDYISDASCGKGICKLGNTPSSCVEGFEISCVPGEPIGETDGICDGLDDDCDGSVDEDYVPDASCGIGYCQLENTPSACAAGQESECVPAEPFGEVDDQCDYIDDDCDGQTDEDADPPCATGSPVAGADVIFLSTLGTVSGIVADNGDGTYSSTVVDLTNPNLNGAVSASCNGNTSDPIGFSVVAGEVTAVELAVSRPEVCADEASVRACARVTDDLGAPAANNISVQLSLDIGGDIVSQTGAAVGDGIFCAWLATPGDTFDAGAAGIVTAVAEGISSESIAVDAIPLPNALTLEVGEVGMLLPLCPRLGGSTFEVPVVVNTGDSELGSYIITCSFNGNVLSAAGVAKGSASAMGEPMPSIMPGSVSFTALNNEVDGSATGPAVEIALITFQVSSIAGDGDSAVVSCEVKDLFNTNMVSILSNPAVQVHDGDGQGDNGFVDASSLEVSGLFTVLTDNALINMAQVSGDAAVALVKVMGLMNDGVLEDIAAKPGTVCEVADPGVGVSAGCAVTGTGAGSTMVIATAGSYASETPLWVLGPELPGQVTLTDSNLRYIPHIDRLQDAQIQVVATFTDGDLFAFELDITDHASFISMAPVFAQVNASGLVTGVGDGPAMIVAIGAAGDELGSASVQVENTQTVDATFILVVVPATVQVTGLEPMSIPDDLGETATTATITNLFDTDGQQVQASVLLILSDDEETGGGSRIDITGWKDSESGGATSFGESDGAVVSVDDDGMVTAVGTGQASVQVSFENSSTGYTEQGGGVVEVQLPPPQSVDLTVADPRLALDEDDSAHTILGLPAERQLGVLVHFVNGTSKDFTTLPQTVYMVTGNLVSVTNFADCVGVPGCVPGTVASTGQGIGTATVTVSFPGTYLQVLTADLVLEVVSHDEILLKSVEIYTPQGEEPVVDQVLSWVECTTTHQQTRLIVEEVFSDGSVVDISAHPDTTYGMDPDDTVISVDPDTDQVTAVGMGMADVQAMNGEHSSALLSIQVDDAHLDVSSLLMTYAGGATFHGVKDTGTGQLDVVATFADGTRMLLTGPDFITGLLIFASDSPGTAVVDSMGIMTAKGNGLVNMTVDLNDGVDCEGAYDVAPGLALKVNLLPAAGDVDMGHANGLAFPDQAADAIFEIPVRVNTGGKNLGGVDLEINFDPAVIIPMDAEVGAALTGAIFNANLATPGVIYLNASPALNSPVSGGGVEVAVITFQALKADGPQVTFIGGTVVGVVDTGGSVIGTDTPKPIVAGAGQFDPPPGGIWGDANDDEKFSIADVLFVQQIIVEPPLVVPNPTQVVQSDLFPDGLVASNDAFYASRNLARLVYFVEVLVTATGFSGQSEIVVTVIDRDQEPVDENLTVRVELETVANLDTIKFTGGHIETVSGAVTVLEGIGNGEYLTVVSDLMEEEPDGEPIGLVVILDLLGPDGEVLETTAFIQTPFIDPAAEFIPVAYVAEICTADCEDMACGDIDQCGVPCIGECPFSNQICINANCVCGGISCAGKACGEDDGCGSPCDVPCPDPDAACNETGCECETPLCDGDCCPPEWNCKEVPPGSGDMTCTGCTPDCEGKACGEPDGCLWFCDGSCPEVNQVCNDEFICVCGGEFCVDQCCPTDNVCLNDECCEVQTCQSEGWDCGAHFVGCSTFVDCGSCGLHGICDAAWQCDCEFTKCGGTCCNPEEICQGDGQCGVIPTPDCEGKLCGDDDEAGGVCEGPCALSNQACADEMGGVWSCGCVFEECNGVCCDAGLECDCMTGACAAPCTPDCDGQSCGQPDGCCGACPGPCPLTFQYCADGACLCEGNDGFTCDGICCKWGEECKADICDPIYTQDCVGKPCGADDGYGGICLTGACPEAPQTCQDGVCVCEDAFCGGVCCDAGDVCDGDLCCEPLTCAGFGADECGQVYDGCGTTITCGECGTHEQCNDAYTCECQFQDEPCGDVCCDEYEFCEDDECKVVCPKNCDGKACGADDDCGGECDGICAGSNELCVLIATDPSSVWQCQCQGTSCLGKACGDDDGCGGICDGPCPGDKDNVVCAAGGCECAGNDGATCGPLEECCAEGWICTPEGECKVDCTPECNGAECGDDDGCEGKCDGSCPGLNEVCSDNWLCECAGDFCDGTCCEVNNVCYLEACCEVDTCEDLGYSCGAHYIGCAVFEDCGACGDHAICSTAFLCECENVQCGDECCQPGDLCKDGACEPPCNPDCSDVLCGEKNSCGEECTGACGPNEQCNQVAPEDYECGCALVECNGACCGLGELCVGGACIPCDPLENCVGAMCGDDDLCDGICYGNCAGLNEYCDAGTGDCLCANGGLPCDGVCCPWQHECNLDTGICEWIECEPSCVGAGCGDFDGCGFFCDGTCADNRVCVNNMNCVCPEKTCGTECCAADQLCDDGDCCDPVTCAAYGAIECGLVDDGCGNLLDCGVCDEGMACNEQLECECADVICGDACCDEGDTCLGGACCAPECDGKACGEPDLCGFLCDGPCSGEGEVCFDGVCLCGGASCVDKACGDDDGCGGVCNSGACDGENETCFNGTCACANEEPECDGLCCPESFFCLDGECVDCSPDCVGKACGDSNGCPDGYCMGTCEGDDMVCTDQYFCDCAGDWCDGACCPAHNICVEGECCQLDSCDTVPPFGAECGTHDLGCDTLTSCGDCTDDDEYMFCATDDWTCQCEFVECEGECCDPQDICWAGHGCVPCIPDCGGAECGADDLCGGICTEGYCADPLAVCDGGACECPDNVCNTICCPEGWSCKDGECEDICVPICVGKLCGDDDGCGSACPGDCEGVNEICVGGACFCQFAECAGDTCCPQGEICVGGDCTVCIPQTCGEVGASCGFVDDECGVPLFCGACAANEVCADGVCLCENEMCLGFCCASDKICNGIECVDCDTDCTDKDCGDDDNCGGLCDGDCAGVNEFCVAGECTCENIDCQGACCAADEWCIGGDCVYCVPSCDGVCGQPNGCGALCDGACPDSKICIEGACECNYVDCEGICCAAGELCVDGECSCEFDICGGVCCGDGDICLGGECCTPDCENKLCGASNGCAGPCIGPCFGDNQSCDEGNCVCEFDICGDTCCASDEICDPGTLECIDCPRDCEGKNCGESDGCFDKKACFGPCLIENQQCDTQVGVCYCEFASCGLACCASNEACKDPVAGLCELCEPDCDGKACGDDSGCDYPCNGDCPGAFETCDFGVCQCTETDCFGTCCAPGEACANGSCCMLECDGKACGEPDGCGGSCPGDCVGEFVVCAGGQCLCEYIECFGECCQEGSSCANDTCCFAQTCDDLGAECGLPGDGCGNVQFCGACADDRYCAADYTCDCIYDSCGDICCGDGEECIAGECKEICTLDCSEAACGGDNGCGGICMTGSCSDGWSKCYNGVCACEHLSCGDTCCDPDALCDGGACCEPVTCTDLGADCGLIDNGCGGQTSCGVCASTQWCDDLNLCYCTHEFCGDVCCEENQGCTDGVCCTLYTCEDLGANCGAPDDGCGEPLDCGECAPSEVCGAEFQCGCPGVICLEVCCGAGVTQCDGVDGTCGSYTPNCDGKNCGDDDGFGGPCLGPCPPGFNEICEYGVCNCEFDPCGDACCSETHICVDGECVLCEIDCFEKGCSADDGCKGLCDGLCASPYETCNVGVCECLYIACDGICCGPDDECKAGQCEEICYPDCDDEVCGAPDDCGGNCNAGYCLIESHVCLNGVCECSGVPCGNGCCAGNEACVAGDCVCIPSCLAKDCGDDDGCGGICEEGICPELEVCTVGICECEFEACVDACCEEEEGCVDGECACIPNCSQALCGDSDGCEGICDGPCVVANMECVDFECECPSGVICGGGCCEEGLACLDDECCEPAVCEDFPAVECGVIQDVCDGPLFCGSCGSNQWCTGGLCECLYEDCEGACCGEDEPCLDGECCQPATCTEIGVECAVHQDGCNSWVDCGQCSDNELCTAAFECVCEFVTCGDICCAANMPCIDDKCEECVPLCAGKACGEDDGCGDICDGECGDFQFCTGGLCECLYDQCGSDCCAEDLSCVFGECGCPLGGGELCGTTCCAVGESCMEDDVCECAPDCPWGTDCGAPDGCGEFCEGPCETPGMVCMWETGGGCECPFDTCGDGDTCCAATETCDPGANECVFCGPSCEGKVCGDSSGCGYPCSGPCLDTNEVCEYGSCVCENTECNGVCCDQYSICHITTGDCQVLCTPDCAGALCGAPDGCNGICDGTCPAPSDVCKDGECICISDCGGADCGDDDGCGGLCSIDCPDPLQKCALLSGEGCQCVYAACGTECCTESEFCNEATQECMPCISDCQDKDCGASSGCGYLCDGPCPDEFAVCESGACYCQFESCADACCSQTEWCIDGVCECKPQCSPISACGVSDGCGGLCGGICVDPTDVCQDGACTPCVPDCQDKDCGDPSGCGTLCPGPCPGAAEICEEGACVCAFNSCGDVCCEKYWNCIEGACVEICPMDCVDAECGKLDGCGDFCDGTCPGQNDACIVGECVCVPDCTGAACGDDDGCGGLCSVECLDPLQECTLLAGTGCECRFSECGDSCCNANQSCDEETDKCVDCSADCLGEACGVDSGCGYPCTGQCPLEGQVCELGACYCPFETCGGECCLLNDACVDDACCTPDCGAATCGDADGCGGLCSGACLGDYELCQGGSCVVTCVPDCADKACGESDGCSSLCDGTCAGQNEACVEGACVCAFVDCFGVCCQGGQGCFNAECCTPVCDGALCGDADECGGACEGPCAGENTVCGAGSCVCVDVTCDGLCCKVGDICVDDECTCVPSCLDAACGDPDGCGGLCEEGSCVGEYMQCQGGACVCVPICAGKFCGDDDGCGDICDGICEDFQFCNEGVCHCLFEECGTACCAEGSNCEQGECGCPWGGEPCGSTCCTVSEFCTEDALCECAPDCPEGGSCGADNGCGGACPGPCENPDMICLWETGGGCECPFAICGDNCCTWLEVCDQGTGECVDCIPSCQDKDCGDSSGCGYPCMGPCAEANEDCQNGACACMYEECNGVCCDQYNECNIITGDCEVICTPNCDGAECGVLDGCGGFCDGTCPVQGDVCQGGECVCFPDCASAGCGDDDGCGGLCATICPNPILQKCMLLSGLGCHCMFDECGTGCCAESESCNEVTEDCIPCTPNCQDKDCGAPSGCGYLCEGPCPDGKAACEAGVCYCLFESCAGVCCGEDEQCVGGVCG